MLLFNDGLYHIGVSPLTGIGVSPLNGKKAKSINNSTAHDHLLHCNYLPSFDYFSILAHENKKFL